MVVNMYRNRDYCQIWTHQGVLVTHRGVVGQRGVVKEEAIPSTQSEETATQRAVQEAEQEGFSALTKSQNSQILVNFDVSGWEPDEIQSFKNTLQTLLGEFLGWTGNGYCDGFTVGQEGLTMWCVVVDPDLAVQTITVGLDENRLLYDEDGPARIAVEEGDRYTVVFPEEQQGVRLL